MVGCAVFVYPPKLSNIDKEGGSFPHIQTENQWIHPFSQEESELIFRMVKDVYYGKTLRKSFARYEEILDMPNLLEVQKKSYQWFLDTGLREVFKDVAAITDYAGNLELSFIDYSMDEKPKYDVEECKARDATYAAPIKVKVRLRNKSTEEIKEQEIFMGDFPIMTNSGTFVINGAERVIVSQIVRSPGMSHPHRRQGRQPHLRHHRHPLPRRLAGV